DAVGLIVALALLVLNDAALRGQNLLVEVIKQMAHALALQHENHIEGAGRYGLEEIRAVIVRGAVEIGRADRLHLLEPALLVAVLAPKHQVLEEVREPSAAGRLVLRADVVPDVDGNDWRFVVLVNDNR